MSGIYEAAHPALAYRGQMEVYRHGGGAGGRTCVVSFGRRDETRHPKEYRSRSALELRMLIKIWKRSSTCCLLFFSVS